MRALTAHSATKTTVPVAAAELIWAQRNRMSLSSIGYGARTRACCRFGVQGGVGNQGEPKPHRFNQGLPVAVKHCIGKFPSGFTL